MESKIKMSNKPVSYFDIDNNPLTTNDFENIQLLLDKFPLEDITIGDAGEVNNCKVGRLMEDKKMPTILNDTLSKEVFKIIFSEKVKAFIIDNFKFNDVNSRIVIRRCQFNLLGKGSFVGLHLDTDSNPDYELAVIFQLGSKYEGGEFSVKDNNNKTIYSQKPSYGSMTFSNCHFRHEVKEVTEGIRTSLVMFVSTYLGVNKRLNT